MAHAPRAEARIWSAAFKSLGRTPITRLELKPGWRRFGVVDSSGYGNVVSALVLLILLEAPAVHVLLGALMADGVLRGLVRAVLLGSSVYLALWLIGDLRLLRETPGVLLGGDSLQIELGQRVSGTVALANVVSAEVLTTQDGRGAIRVTPKPQPNCRIRLRSAVSMRGLFGRPLTGDVIDVYVDEPAGLASAIEAALRATSTACLLT